jgi:hypothetical protein
MALTKIQSRALAKLHRRGGWESAYGLQESLGTLDALYRKGLVHKKMGLGSMAFPRSSIMYKEK